MFNERKKKNIMLRIQNISALNNLKSVDNP